MVKIGCYRIEFDGNAIAADIEILIVKRLFKMEKQSVSRIQSVKIDKFFSPRYQGFQVWAREMTDLMNVSHKLKHPESIRCC
jgi:hypothetical protein